MNKITKKLSLMLVAFMLLTYVPVLPVSAMMDYSKFGIDYVTTYRNDQGRREFSLNIREEILGEKIKSVKLYLKIARVEYDTYNNQTEVVFDVPTISLNKNSGGSFTGILEEKNIQNFGTYNVDKIEITLEDGSKRVSFNNKFYKSLSENDKENGELISYYNLGEEINPINIDGQVLVEKDIVKLGEEQKVKFSILSSNKEVYPDKIYVNFTNQERNKNQISLASKVDENNYETTLVLTNSLDTGIWYADKLDISDNIGRNFSFNIYSNNFKVVSENTDTIPPTLESIELDKNIYDGSSYDNNPTFKLTATDDLSGVDYIDIKLVNTKDENITTDITEWIYDDEIENNTFNIRVNNIENDGEYEVKYVFIRDKNNNSINYYNEKYYSENEIYSGKLFNFDNINISAINCNTDEEEPEIEILEVKNNKKEIINNSEIDLVVKFKSSKAINEIYVIFVDKMNKDFYFYSRDIELKDGIYTAHITLPEGYEIKEYMANGEYKADMIRLGYESNRYSTFIDIYDTRNNYADYADHKADLSTLDFVCTNPNEDITAPEILDITIDKNIILPGESISGTIKVKDDKSGFVDQYGSANYLNIQYSNGDRDIEIDNINYDDKNKIYTIDVKFPVFVSTGVYTIRYISFSDVADNYRYYDWYNEEDKEVLSRGTVLVKRSLDELLAPVITSNINDNGLDSFKAPFTPIVNSDHGTVTMLLNGQEYNGDVINEPGRYTLFITATGVDGSKSTKKVSFKVTTEINNETKIEDIVEQITKTESKEIEFEVKSDEKQIDSQIFDAIKGTDKTVSFKQDDGTVWTFNGKDIKDENIGNIKISVSNTANEEVKDDISSLDNGARIIHFDHHGALPGKATVKIKVDNPWNLQGIDLTFYYYNPETKKPEKVQGPLSVDKDGYVTVEIEHCSDYFLSAEDDLEKVANMPKITVDEVYIVLKEGEIKKLQVSVNPSNIKPEFVSLDENIAKVTADGEITAISRGMATIKIKAGEAESFVRVFVGMEEDHGGHIITVDKDEYVLSVNEEMKINAKVTPEGTKLYYTSMDDTIATVNTDGVIKGISKGESEIIIDTGATVKSIKVIVNEAKVTEPEEKPNTNPNDNEETLPEEKPDNNDSNIDNPSEKPSDNNGEISKPGENNTNINDTKDDNEGKDEGTKVETNQDNDSEELSSNDDITITQEAEKIESSKENGLPKTGSRIPTSLGIILSMIAIISGVLLYRKK